MTNKQKIKRAFDKTHWPKNTAGYNMTTRVPIARPDETLEVIQKNIFKNIKNIDTLNYIYIVDNKKRLKGVFSIKEFYKKPLATKVKNVMKTNVITISPTADQEQLVYLSLKNNIKAIPVVKGRKKFLGVVPSDKILSIFASEFREDILHFAGIYQPQTRLDNILKISLPKSIKHRIPWLAIGLIGGIFAAFILEMFEAPIRQNLILAMFIPVIVYMSNAVASQAQILFIRDMALERPLPLKQYILKQFQTCFSIGFILSVSLFILVSLFWNSYKFGFILGFSMLLTITAAVIFSLFIPFILNKLKTDPALGSGPFSTIIQDIVSILIYFTVATQLL